VKADDAGNAAKQLEAFFVRQLLSEARPTSSLDGGFAGDTFKQMLDEAIADKIGDAGGIGMAKIFAAQLGKGAAAPAPPPHALPMPIAMPPKPAPITLPKSAESGFVMPAIGRPSSGYGVRVDPIHGERTEHRGFDIAAKTGTPVAAAAAGTVTHAGPAGTYGNLVMIRHADGLETRYAHLSSVAVKKGDHVAAGQEVGAVGTTGRSTGPHLHFEVRRDGQAIDPAPLLPLNSSFRGRPTE
jgi:murein DD-endopeptidase MepM/ murein hydrolase activator NlpD